MVGGGKKVGLWGFLPGFVCFLLFLPPSFLWEKKSIFVTSLRRNGLLLDLPIKF